MLVEGVFLVSGVVKTVFSPNKKNKNFFLFSPRTKKSKADLVGISKSPLFATETHRMFWNFVELFFYSVKNCCIELVPYIFFMAGDNSKRVRREIILCVFIELVLYFFKWREIILVVLVVM